MSSVIGAHPLHVIHNVDQPVATWRRVQVRYLLLNGASWKKKRVGGTWVNNNLVLTRTKTTARRKIENRNIRKISKKAGPFFLPLLCSWQMFILVHSKSCHLNEACVKGKFILQSQCGQKLPLTTNGNGYILCWNGLVPLESRWVPRARWILECKIMMEWVDVI